MTSLYVDRRGVTLKADGEALVFYEDGERVGTVPLAPLSRVFLRGDVMLSSSLLGKFGERGIGVVVLSGRKGEATLFFGRPHNDARLRVEQGRRSLDEAFCLAYARTLVQDKLERQCQWLQELPQRYPQARYILTSTVDQLRQAQARVGYAVNLDRLRGMEGAAAACYFAALRAVVPASLGFNERNRRPPRDPFNALLSLTYTLAQAETAMALHAAGFDPCIGYYHQPSFGRESLACDLLETVRPLADRLCLQLVRSQTLTKDHFSQSTAGCLLGKAGRERYYHAYEEQAEPLRKAIQHSVDALRTTVLPGDEELATTPPLWDADDSVD